MENLIVLCYHALSATWAAALSTRPERFEAQIALLVARGYRGVTFSEALRTVGAGRQVAITFDDAFRSVFEIARPILDRFEMPATVFATTDAIDAAAPMRWPGIECWHAGPHESELTPMSWQQLRSLAAGGWEIGSHTATHPHLTQVDDMALKQELARSKAVCEQRLGEPCRSLAYPYGDVDARVMAAAASAGYSTAAALPSGLSSRDVMEWPRIGVYHTDGELRFRLKISPAVRRLRATRGWDWLSGLRSTQENV